MDHKSFRPGTTSRIDKSVSFHLRESLKTLSQWALNAQLKHLQKNQKIKMSTLQTTTKKTRDYSKYMKEAYAEEVKVQPYAQFLHSSSLNDAGFFISANFKDDIGFKPELGGCVPHKHKTGSGETIEGFLISHPPRLIVVRETELYMIKDETNEVFSFNKQFKDKEEDLAGRKIYTPAKKYLFFFLNQSNELLHTIPVKWTAKGTAGTTFNKALSVFRKEMDQCLQELTGVARKRGNKRLNAFKLAHVFLKPEQMTLQNKTKKWITTISGIASPSTESFSEYFVPDISKELEDMVIDAFESSDDFEIVNKSGSTKEQAPSTEEDLSEVLGL